MEREEIETEEVEVEEKTNKKIKIKTALDLTNISKKIKIFIYFGIILIFIGLLLLFSSMMFMDYNFYNEEGKLLKTENYHNVVLISKK